MRISFRPNPLPQHGTEWMADRTLPYGPFQPTLLDDACSFECDSTLWKLWVEFHQTIRPNLLFPDVGSTPSRIYLEQLGQCMDRVPTLIQYERRLTDRLGRTGTVSFPLNASHSDKWTAVLNTVAMTFPTPSMDGDMQETKLWICIVHELSQFHIGPRIFITDRYPLGGRTKNGAGG